MHIVSAKDAAAFGSLVAAYVATPDLAWSVGNSVRSDINPAIEAGLRGIWVARPTWAYEDGTQLAGEVIKVHSLSEAAEALLK